MKIVFLNTWNAKLPDALSDYIRTQGTDTDIFCFQEAGPELQALAAKLLPDFAAISISKLVPNETTFFNACYVRPTVELLEQNVIPIDSTAGLGLYAHIRCGETTVHVCNVHGMSQPGHKLDTPERIAQSQAIINFLADKTGPKLIGGDFNLLPETKSVSLFAEHGYTNLIDMCAVPTTRNEVAWAKHPHNKQLYADFVFVSDLPLASFNVPRNEASDHLPMEVVLGGLNTKPPAVNICL